MIGAIDPLLELLSRLARWLTRRPELGAGPSPSVSPPSPRSPPPEADHRAGPLVCPEDGAALEPLGDGPGARCPTCAGLFLAPEQDLRDPELAALDRAPTPGARSPRYRRCPACRALMARSNFARVSGVILDRCPRHGTWLDAGELWAVNAFLAAGGDERRAAFEAEERAWQLGQRATIQRWSAEARARRGYGPLFDLDED